METEILSGGGVETLIADNVKAAVLAALEGINRPGERVVESWSSGSSWCRVWSDGFKEQGGYNDFKNGRATVTFHRAFTSTNYAVTFGTKSANTNFFAIGNCVDTKSTTGFTAHSWNDGGVQSHAAHWVAQGF